MFSLWNLWKERNLRLFESKCRPFYMVQELICNNIRETLLEFSRDPGDKKMNEEEVLI